MKCIFLSQNKFSFVDDEDYIWLNQWKWCATANNHGIYYAVRCIGNNKFVRMHRLIMQATERQEIDHRNGNGLDNQKDNLRFCTHSQNMFNMKPRSGTSSYKGVYWDKTNKKWRVQITVGGKARTFGRHTNEIDAARIYNGMAKKYFGEFARLNNV